MELWWCGATRREEHIIEDRASPIGPSNEREYMPQLEPRWDWREEYAQDRMEREEKRQRLEATCDVAGLDP